MMKRELRNIPTRRLPTRKLVLLLNIASRSLEPTSLLYAAPLPAARGDFQVESPQVRSKRDLTSFVSSDFWEVAKSVLPSSNQSCHNYFSSPLLDVTTFDLPSCLPEFRLRNIGYRRIFPSWAGTFSPNLARVTLLPMATTFTMDQVSVSLRVARTSF